MTFQSQLAQLLCRFTDGHKHKDHASSLFSLHVIGVKDEWKVSGFISLLLMDLSKFTEYAVKWEFHYNKGFLIKHNSWCMVYV